MAEYVRTVYAEITVDTNKRTFTREVYANDLDELARLCSEAAEDIKDQIN